MEQNITFLTEASFEKLLGARLFIRTGNQLLFYHEGMKKHVIATIDPNENYTTADYYQLPEGVPYQLINKKLVYMPAPTPEHQDCTLEIATEIKIFLRNNNLGKVYIAPIDVEFSNDIVIQPDTIYISIARKSIIKEKRIVGAPEFVLETLSPGTENIDRTTKMTVYGLYDVVEYWLVHPSEKYIEVYYNFGKTMQLVQTARENDIIVSKAIEGFELDVARIFR